MGSTWTSGCPLAVAVLGMILFTACGSKPAVKPVITHEGRGRVVAVDHARGRIRLDHESMPGYMDAMTMWFLVKEPGLLAGVKEGDSVVFTVSEEASADVITRLETVRTDGPGSATVSQ